MRTIYTIRKEEKLDTSTKTVSRWVSTYKNVRIEALLSKRKGSNRWYISFEEEEKLFQNLKKRQIKGK